MIQTVPFKLLRIEQQFGKNAVHAGLFIATGGRTPSGLPG